MTVIGAVARLIDRKGITNTDMSELDPVLAERTRSRIGVDAVD